MNVAPAYTLDTVEAIVTHHEVDVRGLLLTLKLPDWKLAAEVPDWLARIRSWGYAEVRAGNCTTTGRRSAWRRGAAPGKSRQVIGRDRCAGQERCIPGRIVE